MQRGISLHGRTLETSQRRLHSLLGLPSTLYLLTRKAHANKIAIGSDPAQIRFLELKLGAEVSLVPFVNDDMLLGHSGHFFEVRMADGVANLSPEMRAKNGIWSAEPIVNGSPSMYLLLRRAGEIAGSAADGDIATLALTGDAVVAAGITDVYNSLGLAVRLLSQAGASEPKRLQPWEDPYKWSPIEQPIEKRLAVLHRTLTLHRASSVFGSHACLAGLSKAVVEKHEQLRLPEYRVLETIRHLDGWRDSGMTCSHRTYLDVAQIWRDYHAPTRSQAHAPPKTLTESAASTRRASQQQAKLDRDAAVCVFAEGNPTSDYATIAEKFGVAAITVARACSGLRGRGWRKSQISQDFDPECLWSKVSKGDATDCWLWRGRPNSSGYGVLYARGKSTGAHRMAYEVEHGSIPPGMDVHHTSGRRLCVNPRHLQAMTHAENLEIASETARKVAAEPA